MGLFTDMVSSRGGNPKQGQIDRLCRELGWNTDERDDHLVYLSFNDALGETRHVIGICDGVLTRFAAVSNAHLPADWVPPEFFRYLLERNGAIYPGAWLLKDGEDGCAAFTFTFRTLGDGLDAAALKEICTWMVSEVTAFDGKMKAAGCYIIPLEARPGAPILP